MPRALVLAALAVTLLSLTACQTDQSVNKSTDTASNPAKTEPLGPPPTQTRPAEPIPPPVLKTDAGTSPTPLEPAPQ
jgi:hypothetical protein